MSFVPLWPRAVGTQGARHARLARPRGLRGLGGGLGFCTALLPPAVAARGTCMDNTYIIMVSRLPPGPPPSRVLGCGVKVTKLLKPMAWLRSRSTLVEPGSGCSGGPLQLLTTLASPRLSGAYDLCLRKSIGHLNGFGGQQGGCAAVTP